MKHSIRMRLAKQEASGERESKKKKKGRCATISFPSLRPLLLLLTLQFQSLGLILIESDQIKGGKREAPEREARQRRRRGRVLLQSRRALSQLLNSIPPFPFSLSALSLFLNQTHLLRSERELVRLDMGLRMGSSEPTRGRPPPPGVTERAGPAPAAAAAPELSGATLDVGTAACVTAGAAAEEPLPSGAGEPDAFSKGVAMVGCSLSLH